MSRIGKKPVPVPESVGAAVDGQQVHVTGPKGELSVVLNRGVRVRLSDECILVEPATQSQRDRAMWGLARTLIANIVHGVTKGFRKVLDINGVGYRAQVQGSILRLNMGYSCDVLYPIPEDVQIECVKPTEISISGIEAQRVGQVAAEIRRIRPPEPYKGKGIRYRGERILRKEGKKK